MPQAWSIEVELGVTDVSDDIVEDLHDHLADCSPAIGIAPSGNLSARISVEAGTVRQAVDAALKSVTAAAKAVGTSHRVVGVEAMTEQELDRRLAEPSVPELVGISEIAAMLGVVRQRAAQLVQREDFPPPVTHLKSGPVFVKWQVEAFEKRWDRRSGRPAKAVQLTDVEAALLAALGAAAHAAGARPPSGRVRAADAALRETLKDLSVGAHAGVLQAAFPRHDTAAAEALATLEQKSLVSVQEETKRDNEVVVELELTPRGERLAACQ
jgi:hypothetical protein